MLKINLKNIKYIFLIFFLNENYHQLYLQTVHKKGDVFKINIFDKR
jgi:hypothetical protein